MLSSVYGRSFQDYERRLNWAADILNSALEHEAKADGSLDHWAFETVHFRSLALALFRPVLEVTSTADSRVSFAAVYGEDKLKAVREFFESARLT